MTLHTKDFSEGSVVIANLKCNVHITSVVAKGSVCMYGKLGSKLYLACSQITPITYIIKFILRLFLFLNTV